MSKLLPFKRKRKFSHNWGVATTKPKGPSNAAVVAIGLALGGAIGGIVLWPSPQGMSAKAADAPGYSATFTLCHTGGGTNCVVDGDTFWVGGEKVRVMDIDAPETHPSRCPSEADLGNQATLRLQGLLNEGPFQMETGDRDIDKYGRKLRVVSRGGRSLGAVLVDEGLAREWTGSRQPWC